MQMYDHYMNEKKAVKAVEPSVGNALICCASERHRIRNN